MQTLIDVVDVISGDLQIPASRERTILSDPSVTLQVLRLPQVGLGSSGASGDSIQQGPAPRGGSKRHAVLGCEVLESGWSPEPKIALFQVHQNISYT
jgi:hypothetical protein